MCMTRQVGGLIGECVLEKNALVDVLVVMHMLLVKSKNTLVVILINYYACLTS
jgi:hypothetical protein